MFSGRTGRRKKGFTLKTDYTSEQTPGFDSRIGEENVAFPLTLTVVVDAQAAAPERGQAGFSDPSWL
jgi:hypothetical protein